MNSWGRPGRSVCDETGDARLLAAVFCRLWQQICGGQAVGGYRLLVGASKQNTPAEKRRTAGVAWLNKPVVVALSKVPPPELAELHKDCCFLKDDGSPQKRRAVYQAADFYLAGEEESPGGCPESWRRAVSRLRRQKPGRTLPAKAVRRRYCLFLCGRKPL